MILGALLVTGLLPGVGGCVNPLIDGGRTSIVAVSHQWSALPEAMR